jgi:Fe-S-cluster-containing dehydrogenase component
MQEASFLGLTQRTSCYACLVACKAHHAILQERIFWPVVLILEAELYPEVRLASLALPFTHCVLPWPIEVCPKKPPQWSEGALL